MKILLFILMLVMSLSTLAKDTEEMYLTDISQYDTIVVLSEKDIINTEGQVTRVPVDYILFKSISVGIRSNCVIVTTVKDKKLDINVEC